MSKHIVIVKELTSVNFVNVIIKPDMSDEFNSFYAISNKLPVQSQVFKECSYFNKKIYVFM